MKNLKHLVTISKSTVITFVLNFSIFSICLLSFSYYLYQSVSDNYKQTLLDENALSAKQTNNAVEIFLDEIIKQSVPIMLDIDINSYALNKDDNLKIRIYNKIALIKSQNDNFSSIYLYSEEENSILSTEGYWKLDSFYDVDWTRYFEYPPNVYHWLGSRFFYDNVHTQKQQVFSIFRKYVYKDELKGALIININTKKINSILNMSAARDTVFFVITDEYGEIVAASNGLYEHASDLNKFSGNPDNVVEYFSNAGYIVNKIQTKNGWNLFRCGKYEEFKFRMDIIARLFLKTVCVIILFGIIIFAIASDYITVPLKKLISNLDNINEIKGLNRNKRDEYKYLNTVFNQMLETNTRLTELYAKSLPVLQDRWIKSVLAGDDENSGSNCNADMHALKIDMHEGFFKVAVVDYFTPDDAAFPENNKEFIIIELKSCFAKSFNKYKVVLSDTGYNQFTAIISTDALEPDHRNGDVDICRLYINDIRMKFGITVSIGIGRYYNSINDIAVSRLEAEKVLGYQALAGKGNAISYEDFEPGELVLLRYPKDIENQLLAAYKSNDLEKSRLMLEKIFAFFKEKEAYSFTHLQGSVLRLFVSIFQATIGKNINLENVFGLEYDIYRDFGSLKTIGEIEKWFLNFITDIVAADKLSRISNYDRIIQELLNHLDTSFGDEWTLETAAQYVYLSPQYFNKIFKKHTSRPFIDYLLNLRLNKAKQMLLNTTLQINEISRLCGFGSQHYFNKVFKKNINMTPCDFRRAFILKKADGNSN